MPPSRLAPLHEGSLPLLLVAGTTAIAIAVSIISLEAGGLTIFQNLYYIPIILACMFFTRRGFYFSVLLSFPYLALMLAYSRELSVIEGALIRIVIFIFVAAIVTFIASRRMLAEEALRESEARYSALFDHNYSISLLIYPDTGRIVEANEAACRYYGYSRDELLARGIYDLNRLPREKVITHLVQAKNEKEKHFFTTHYIADGERRNVEVYSGPITVRGTPLFYSVIHDVTERKQAEEALRESRLRLTEAMDMAHMVSWEFDVSTGIFLFNDRFYALYGTTAEREGGYLMPAEVYAREFVHPDDRHLVADEVRRAIEATDPDYTCQIEHRIIRRDGEVRHIIVRFRIAKDGAGRTVKTYGANQDITGRKQMEEALHRANRQLGLLSSITRHDILNQLTALRGYLDLSTDLVKDQEVLAEYIRKEERAAANIEQQIIFTRDYQELGAAAPVWLSVKEAVEKAAAQLPLRGITVDPGHAYIEVLADRLFEKVCYNLIDNALRYGGPGMTTIRFSARESDQGLVLVCEDDGAGISAEDKKRLFTRGFGKNTGLGLFLSREILMITGITITENGIPGKGARFELLVPKRAYRFSDT